jgi:hypothetical protein
MANSDPAQGTPVETHPVPAKEMEAREGFAAPLGGPLQKSEGGPGPTREAAGSSGSAQ